MVEIKLPLHLSIEADVLYHPFDVQTYYKPSSHVFLFKNTYSVIEVPVAAKYRLSHAGPGVPFVLGGVALRNKPGALATDVTFLNTNGGNISPLGTTIGAGVEFRAFLAKISPEFRYTRWNKGSLNANSPSIEQLNQVVVMVGVSF